MAAGLRFTTGLDFNGAGGVRAGQSSQPASIGEAAYGAGYTDAAPNLSNALTPNDPFGVSFWAGIGAIVLLVVIRQSLPR